MIAGGGNTSVKDDKIIWVKASGFELGKIDENGFVALDRQVLKKLSVNDYSQDEKLRENEVKSDLLKSRIYPEKNQRPSVETSVHDAIKYPYVVHLHATLVNGLMCSHQAEKSVKEIFGHEVVYLDYITPGYILFKEIENQNQVFNETYGYYPKVFFLENHGIFVGGNSAKEVKRIYDDVFEKIGARVETTKKPQPLPIDKKIVDIMPAIRASLSTETLKIARIRYNNLIEKYIASPEACEKISQPLTPDGIVYCRPYPLYIENAGSPAEILAEYVGKLEAYRSRYGYDPKIILIRNIGMIAVEDNSRSVEIALDVFEDIIRIADLAENFGGVKPMTREAIDFIVNWEVEAYRKGLMNGQSRLRTDNMVVVITGGGQGFGKGIAEGLMEQGANVVIPDINETVGQETVREFSQKGYKNEIAFVKTNITNKDDLKNLAFETTKRFGGIDVLISNAGVLRAGSLEELSEEDFDLVTQVNYKGYFLCVKYLSPVMKLQNQYNPDLFMDIIQINSKSGLQGSNKNYAYAGGKFGGIGLTQSFALELIPNNIKVNAICPGNFYEGPLWSDPEKGLFAQYLAAGKAPGAKTIADVKKFYESKTPVGRGCYPSDVVKSILYVIEQRYETGQAVPVTGGQVMIH